jgi:tetratricopeptide (TPR) repeat protein
MQRFIFLFAICVIFFGACKNETTPTLGTTGPVTSLSADAVYQFDSVVAYLQQARASQADTAKKLFLQAIDLYKNKKEAASSVPLFRQSLQFFPDNKTYYELGNALLATNRDSLAFQAFDMAERLDYNPLSYVLFKKACCLGGMAGEEDWERREQAITYLKNAIENGFADRERIYNEPKLAAIRTGEDFTYMYNDAMSGNGDPAAVLWSGYSGSFPACSFPLTINMETVKNIKQPAAISYDFEKFVTEMRDYKFSRDVGQEFFYMAKVASTPDHETVVYGSRSYDAGDDLPYVPTRFYLASYDKKGKLIDKLELAGQQSFDQVFKVATMQQNGHFEIKDYQNTWAKPVGDDGYANNKVVKSDLVKTSRYSIGTDGKFNSDAELLGMAGGDVKGTASRPQL